jgi:hypothetical protein
VKQLLGPEFVLRSSSAVSAFSRSGVFRFWTHLIAFSSGVPILVQNAGQLVFPGKPAPLISFSMQEVGRPTVSLLSGSSWDKSLAFLFHLSTISEGVSFASLPEGP